MIKSTYTQSVQCIEVEHYKQQKSMQAKNTYNFIITVTKWPYEKKKVYKFRKL